MTDSVYHGDCLDILPTLPARSVHLVYLDPPFFTQKTHELKSRDLTAYAFEDTWQSLADYITFLRLRLLALYRVMRDDATLFFHCDRNASHHIRLLLDDIFGADHFVSEIIWSYRRWANTANRLLPAHQTIFMYRKSQTYTFNHLYQAYSETTNLDQILQKRVRNQHGKAIYATDEAGHVILNGPKQGVPLSDVWEIPYLNPKARERTGYPTQKPIALLERIIQIASQKGDVILDPFCGSGTSLVAALLHERHYIGIDSSPEAIALTQKRLEHPVRSESPLMKNGREAYHNLPDEVVTILASLPVKLVQRNQGIDAIYDYFIEDKPIVVRVQRQGEPLADAVQKLEQAGKKKQASLMVLIRTDSTAQHTLFDMPDNPNLLVIDALSLTLKTQLQDKIMPQ